ncbi:MAG: hypothetical protein ABIH20_05440 [Candidatus Diapherotrites archaeon]
MIWEIIVHLVALDFAWIIGLVLSNLLIVFMFFALGYIFFNGKNPIRSFIHLILAPLLFFELIPFLGWAEVSGQLVALYYIINLSLMKMLENNKFFSSRLVWIEEFTFFGALILFNGFM